MDTFNTFTWQLTSLVWYRYMYFNKKRRRYATFKGQNRLSSWAIAVMFKSLEIYYFANSGNSVLVKLYIYDIENWSYTYQDIN